MNGRSTCKSDTGGATDKITIKGSTDIKQLLRGHERKLSEGPGDFQLSRGHKINQHRGVIRFSAAEGQLINHLSKGQKANQLSEGQQIK